MKKKPLYYFDSSDEENDHVPYVKKFPSKIYLYASHVLTGISQNIINHKSIRNKYLELKNKLRAELAWVIPEAVDHEYYTQNNKALGRLLLDPTPQEELKNSNFDIETSNSIQRITEHYKKLVNDIIGTEDIKQDVWDKVCKELLGATRISKYVKIFAMKVQSKYEEIKKNDSKYLLTSLFNELLKDTSFKQLIENPDSIIQLLGTKTIEGTFEEVKSRYFAELVKIQYDKFKLSNSGGDKKLNYKNFICSIPNKPVVTRDEVKEEQNNDEVDLSEDEYKLLTYYIFNKDSLLPNYFAYKNQPIAQELMSYREIFLPAFSEGIDYFANFLLSHRIIKAKLKTSGALLPKSKSLDIMSARIVSNIQKVPVIDKFKINSGGTRGDYEFLPTEQGGSYRSVAVELGSFTQNISQTVDNIKNARYGRLLEGQFTLSHQIYLYRLTNLLFNCEGERNISTFLSNIIFFDLVKKGTYNIGDLDHKLPMAMKGAVQASRYTLDILYGKYGKNNEQAWLKKRQHFDYKNTTFGKTKLTQDAIKEKLLHYELSLKDSRLLHDWVKSINIEKGGMDIVALSEKLNQIIEILSITNRIYDSNTKEFNGQDISNVTEKNKVYILTLKKCGFGKAIIENFNIIVEALEAKKRIDENSVSSFYEAIKTINKNSVEYLVIKNYVEILESQFTSKKKISDDNVSHDNPTTRSVSQKTPLSNDLDNFITHIKEFFNAYSPKF